MLFRSWGQFQSTRPVWGATGLRRAPNDQRGVSIHAPRVGRDLILPRMASNWMVSIHAPRVGRDDEATMDKFMLEMFQSTRPVWGATFASQMLQTPVGVSIHAPRVGRDFHYKSTIITLAGFNPRAPCGARPP